MKRTPILSLDRFDPSREHAFYVNHFSAHLRDFHADIDHPHRHDFYLVVIISRGSGFHDIDFKRYDVQPGSVFILQPGQTHYWEFSEDIEGYVLFHSLSFYRFYFPEFPLHQLPFFRSRQQNPLLQLIGDESELIIEQLGQLLIEYSHNSPFRHAKLAALLSACYVDLARLYGSKAETAAEEDSRYAVLLSQFEQRVELHFRDQHTPGYYAGQLNISSRHLNRICQALLGKTSSQFIAERIVLEARKKLAAGEKHLGIIASELGFEEYSYFSRFFKVHTGERPKAFKEKAE